MVMVFIIGSIIACQQKLSPKEQLQTILHSTPSCKAPCWHDIEPGKSTENDFLSRVENSSEPEFYNLREQRIDIQRTYYVWENRVTDYVGSLEIRDGEIAYITFQQLNKELTLKTTIELLGMPDAYIASVAPGEAFLLDLNLIFVEEGLIINTRIVPYDPPPSAFQPSCEIIVPANMPVNEIILTEPSASANDTIHNISGLVPAFEEPQTWPGFGPVMLTSCPR